MLQQYTRYISVKAKNHNTKLGQWQSTWTVGSQHPVAYNKMIEHYIIKKGDEQVKEKIKKAGMAVCGSKRFSESELQTSNPLPITNMNYFTFILACHGSEVAHSLIIIGGWVRGYLTLLFFFI